MNPYLAALLATAGITGIAAGVGPDIRAWWRRHHNR
jgi:hypothetical protein